MPLFNNNQTKTKTSKIKNTVPRRKSRFSSEGVETVVEVKTVGDIPPVLEARKLIGENNLNSAAKVLFQAARDDYIRYFGATGSISEGNRHFFISELASFKVKVPEIGYVDGSTILEALNQIEAKDENHSNRINALKKLTSFYLSYYERARFSGDYDFNGDELVSKFSEIYNYMDIMKLYFSRHAEGNR